MKKNFLGKVLLSIICTSSLGYSMEPDDSIYPSADRNKLTKLEQAQKTDKNPEDTSAKQTSFQYVVFPEEAEKLVALLKDGPTDLSIYIGKGKFPLKRSWFADNPAVLEKLRSLTVFHYITKDASYDEEKVSALLPLFKAPNLRKVVFTHFLAPSLLPLLSNEIEITLDFLPRHITDPILPRYFIEGYRARALEWNKTYPNHKIYIPEITPQSFPTPDAKS